MAATIHYRNATLLVAGGDLSGTVTELSIAYGAEALDATTMGAFNRVKKGGLFTVQITGKLLYDSVDGLSEDVLFPITGTDDQVITLFPNGVVEGATAGTGTGFSCRGVLTQFNIGGAVGTLLPIAFTVEGRGVGV